MADCICLPKCLFFNDKMENMPSMAQMYKAKYCIGDKSKCARYMVFEKKEKTTCLEIFSRIKSNEPKNYCHKNLSVIIIRQSGTFQKVNVKLIPKGLNAGEITVFPAVVPGDDEVEYTFL